MTSKPSFEDVLGCQEALFGWADSYDAKAWDELSKHVAPELKIDYSSFMNKSWDALPKDEFLKMVQDKHFLGNPLIKTQHLVGTGTWSKTSDDEIVGMHQMRVAHQVYTDESFSEVAVKGHAHGAATVWYRRVDGEWKFAGIRPIVRWAEFDYDKVFAPPQHDSGEKPG